MCRSPPGWFSTASSCFEGLLSLDTVPVGHRVAEDADAQGPRRLGVVDLAIAQPARVDPHLDLLILALREALEARNVHEPDVRVPLRHRQVRGDALGGNKAEGSRSRRAGSRRRWRVRRGRCFRANVPGRSPRHLSPFLVTPGHH